MLRDVGKTRDSEVSLQLLLVLLAFDALSTGQSEEITLLGVGHPFPRIVVRRPAGRSRRSLIPRLSRGISRELLGGDGSHEHRLAVGVAKVKLVGLRHELPPW